MVCYAIFAASLRPAFQALQHQRQPERDAEADHADTGGRLFELRGEKLRAGIRHGGFCRRLGPKLCKSNGRQRSHKGAIPETRFLLLSASMSSFEVTIRP
jgi:hypothetical protein